MALDNNYFYAIMDYFPAQDRPQIKKALESIDEDQEVRLLATDFKKPTLALLMSFSAGIFGMDRFYNEDKGLAIGKLSLTIAAAVFYLTIFLFFIGALLLIAVTIWTLVDWFLIVGAVKTKNTQRFYMALNGIPPYASPALTYGTNVPSQATDVSASSKEQDQAE